VPLTVNGLMVEVVGREIAGRPVAGRPRRAYGPYLLGLPAVVLMSLLVIPAGFTAVRAFRAGHGGFSVANFAVLGDPAAKGAMGHTLVWVGVALALVAIGSAIALAGYRMPGLWRVLQPALVIPFAMSALIAGAAFRLIFDPEPARGTVAALTSRLFHSNPVWLGPGLVWVVLVSAFCWIWLGYVVSLFRAGLESIPQDLARTVRAEGPRGWRRLRLVELPILRPVTGIIALTLVVAAVRLFDLVLVVAQGLTQSDANVLALHWWRTHADAPGRSAALALVLFVVVAVLAVTGMRGLRRRWAMPPDTVPADARPSPPPPSRRGSAVGLAVGIPVAACWAFPVLVLAMTSLHAPATAGLHGWWSAHGLGFGSFAAAGDAGLWRALLSNGLIAGLATLVVLAVALPTAYLLAWGGLPGWLGRAGVAAFVVLAVLPVQMYADPLRTTLLSTGLGNSRVSLALVHAAAGLPFAVLLLRAAFAAAPASLVAEALLHPSRRGEAIDRVRQGYRPVLTAVLVLEFVLVWNDFIVGFLIGGPGSAPLSQVLWGQARQFATSAGPVAAAAVMWAALPVVTLLATWPTVVRGLTVGTRP
jgi:alpha-glucoside transport system permease protein